MPTRQRRIRAVCLAGLAALLILGGAVYAGQAGESGSPTTEAGPKVCLVTVEGPLGLPVAFASGFLLGEGKFVVTDLASVARPGVRQVTIRFRDGSTAVGKQFGMADPVLGLVVIKLEEPRADLGGLGFSATPPPETGGEAVIIGWKWGQELGLVKGTIRSGVSTTDLATLTKVAAPPTASTFMTFVGARVDVASGAPVLDASGGVAGMFIDIAGLDKPIVVPSGLLKSALLASGVQLKPLAELPKPLWPIAVVSFVGKPVTGTEFANTVRAAKARSRCGTCGGKGTVTFKKHIRTERTPIGTLRNIFQDVTETCKTCNGEGVVCTDGLYSVFANMAYDAAWLMTSPDIEPKVKEAALTNGSSMLTALAKVGVRYRDAFVTQANADLGKAAGEFPRGLVVYAQVRENIEGPDGRYALLVPYRSPTVLVAAKAEHLVPPPAPDGKSAGAAPAPGAWVVLGGAAEGVAPLQTYRPILVRPFGWAACGSLGQVPGPHRPGPGPVGTPSDQPPPRRPSGEPDFFGL